MDIHVSFPGGKRVDASVGTHVIRTDQPATAGGEDTAPAPFDLFLASLGTCAGLYVLAFCQARGIPTEGLELVQHTGPEEISVEIRLPPEFPDKYRDAIVRAAEQCKVKKLLSHPPRIDVCAVQ
jgi:ribosomal protein S12 methylthiotransferase accessory factor